MNSKDAYWESAETKRLDGDLRVVRSQLAAACKDRDLFKGQVVTLMVST